jgi:hypothetical protein
MTNKHSKLMLKWFVHCIAGFFIVWYAASCFGQAIGSPYVPLDNWVYPAIERVAASEMVNSAYLGQRPWTRLQCAEFVQEIRHSLRAEDLATSREDLYRALELEFTPELRKLASGPGSEIVLESLYARSTQISGTPLTDSYHFGKTIANDFGRPYFTGNNDIAGGSIRGSSGRFFAYVRGEYQHATAIPSLTLAQQKELAAVDRVPLAPNVLGRDQVNVFRLLDTYAGVRLGDTQVTFGKQSLWQGPGESGAVLFSNNVDPLYMLRINQVEPKRIGGFFKYLGPVTTDFFIAKMSGHLYPQRPFIHGEKISFKPTENFEFGFSRTALFLGQGNGFTFGRFEKSYFSLSSPITGPDPGDRKGGFDFSYRVPGLRRWLTIYNDSFADDDPSPLDSPRRAAWNPGIYMQIPMFRNLDVRAEGVYTDRPSLASVGGVFVYYNAAYKDGYTNKGNMLGNVVGREGKAVQLQSTYWFTGRDTLQLMFRGGRVASDFIPGGGTQDTFRIRGTLVRHNALSIVPTVQYERWDFPFLALLPRSNVSASIEITYTPTKIGFFRGRKQDVQPLTQNAPQ